MALTGLIGGALKTAQAAATIKRNIGGRKKRGAQVRGPKMSNFVKDVEQKKVEIAPQQKLLPTLTPIKAESSGEETSRGIEDKISILLKFVRERKAIKKERRENKKESLLDQKRKDKENKKENFAKGLVKGAKNVTGKALAPVKSVWDNIMNAIGTIVLAQISLWAIDNPKAFAAILNGLTKLADVISDILVGVLDIVSGVVSFGYDLVHGFDDWSGTEDGINKLGDWAPAITAFLNTALLLGGALADEALRPKGDETDTTQDRSRRRKSTRRPRTRSSRLTQTRRTSKLARQRYARRFGTNAARNRFAGNVAGRRSLTSSITGRGGIGRSITRFGIKINPGMMRNFKFLTKMAKGIKIPIIGPLLIGVGSIMGGDPLDKALFKTLGAVGGGILGSLIPIPFLGTVLGEAIGLFAGELLYEGFMGNGWGAAGQILVDTFNGFVTGAGKFGKALGNWIFGGGLSGLLKNIGGGLLKFGKYLLGGGLLMTIAKGAAGFGKMLVDWLFGGGLWNLLKSTAGGVKLLTEWIGSVFGKFIEAFKTQNKLPKWLGGGTNWLQILNPIITTPLLLKAFFGVSDDEDVKGGGEKKDVGEKKKEEMGLEPRKQTSDNTVLKEEDLKGVQSSSAKAVPTLNQGGDSSSGGGGGASGDQQPQVGDQAIVPIPTGSSDIMSPSIVLPPHTVAIRKKYITALMATS